jgi:CRISPR-associated endonuclease/helicase Cas3
LAGKTVIFDEVHAYDAYMTTILERLLEWLASLGSSVILLSATLPLRRRNDLLEAYRRGLKWKDDEKQEENGEKPQDVCYPRISWVTSKQYGAKRISTSPQSARVLTLEWVDGTLNDEPYGFCLGERLQASLSRGGCAAVICNTVDHAQEVYQALKPYFPDIAEDAYPELDLLHARFLFGERMEREKRTLCRFGKKGDKVKFDDGTEHTIRRPHRAVLVATQVIEQSLDLDFDLMVTEMAPVDLILQRAGRLQRHQQKRPPDFDGKPATIWICEPEVKEDGLPDFGGGTEAIYDRHVLLRSWLALNKYSSIRVPEDVEELIEAAYGADDWSGNLPKRLRQDWQESLAKHEKQLERERDEAAERWIKNPDYAGEIWRMTYEPREEDDPGLHPAHQALTRLGGLDISAICLYYKDEKLYLDARYSQYVNSQASPDIETVKKLLRNSVRLSRRGVAFSLIEKGRLIPQAWRENPLLRHHYLLCFSAEHRCKLDNYALLLDAELGLVIEYKKV